MEAALAPEIIGDSMRQISSASASEHDDDRGRRRHEGELAAAISNAVVDELARTTGRGPTKARTTLGENGVFVVLQDSLTHGERTLAEAGQSAAVLDLRDAGKAVMQTDVSREIEKLTGTQGDRLDER